MLCCLCLAYLDKPAQRRLNYHIYISERPKKSRTQVSSIITKTHQEIAYELNSSRVVISRLLKALENEGKIKLNRNNIELLN